MTYAPALPEIVLAVGAMLLLMYGAFRSPGRESSETPGWLAILILAAAAVAVALQEPGVQRLSGGAFVVDGFARFMKLLILAGSAAALLLTICAAPRS
jgi:NADH-quinone oxidoreductase subunit N